MRPASDGDLVTPKCSPHRLCHSSLALGAGVAGGRLGSGGWQAARRAWAGGRGAVWRERARAHLSSRASLSRQITLVCVVVMSSAVGRPR